MIKTTKSGLLKKRETETNTMKKSVKNALSDKSNTQNKKKR